MPAFGGIATARWGALATGNGGAPTAAEWPTVGLALLAFAVVGAVVLHLAGLMWVEALALSVLAPALVLVDVPLGEGASGVRLFVNAAGCLLPIAVGVVVILTRKVSRVTVLPLLAAGVGLALVFSWVVPARGVLLDYRACALGVGLVAAALLHATPRKAGALAFAAAAIGTTIGADLLRLDTLMEMPSAAIITLGGAGLLDGIILTSVLASVVAALSAVGVRAITTAGRTSLPARA